MSTSSVLRDQQPAALATAQPAAEAPWVVAAMSKNVFLDATESWASRLSAAGRPTFDLRADRARRSDLVEAVRAGPTLVLYAGHGRARGWAGYQALRIEHFERAGAAGRGQEPLAPAGLVVAFACSTLDRSTDRVPFGQLLVDRGIARCYLAPAGPIVTAEAELVAEMMVTLVCAAVVADRPYSAADLVADLDTRVDGAAASGWATFELVGDPAVRIV